MTLEGLLEVPHDDSVTQADPPVPAGARHRAPEPDTGTAPDDTIVIRPGWAAYGRHAAPASGSSTGTPLPALPVRQADAPWAARPVVDEPSADAGRDAAVGHAPACSTALEQDTADAADPDPATPGGVLRRCLGLWKRSAGTSGGAAQDADGSTRCA